MKPASKSKECPRMSKVKRPAFTMYRLHAARKHTQLRKKLLTDYMLFGMLIAKRKSAMVVTSGRSGRSGRRMVGMFACLHAYPP